MFEMNFCQQTSMQCCKNLQPIYQILKLILKNCLNPRHFSIKCLVTISHWFNNFLRKYTARYGADSCDMLQDQYNHVINRLGVRYHGYDNCHTRCNINATFYAVVVKLCPNRLHWPKKIKEPRVQVLCL